MEGNTIGKCNGFNRKRQAGNTNRKDLKAWSQPLDLQRETIKTPLP
jgi:hypothetical protein